MIKNFAVIVDQDGMYGTKKVDDNVTRISPKLTKYRKLKALSRSAYDKSGNAVELGVRSASVAAPYVLAATVSPVFAGVPLGTITNLGLIPAVKNLPKLKARHDYFRRVYKISRNKFYILDYLDENSMRLLGDVNGYPKRSEALRAFNLDKINYKRNGDIYIHKGSVLLTRYPNKFVEIQ